MSKKRGVDVEREKLLRIIGLCLTLESRGVNPFEVEVQEVLSTLRKYLPNWKLLDDIVLDAETLNRVASIVRLQGNWLKRRSTALFIDPLLLELKLRMMEPSRFLEILTKAWHPVVEMESLSKKRIEEAIDYWNNLVSLDRRRLQLPEASADLGFLTQEELLKRKLLSEESFKDVLNRLWQELRQKAVGERRVRYWDFIHAKTYEESVNRAYLVSFLITYGYVNLEINPLEEEVFLIPNEKVVENSRRQAISIPIAVDGETWRRMRGPKN